ncbi:MAG: RNA polymerase sigma factor SigA [Anaerolineae bacterium]|nr:RNA polymerase sigma factor SigA [Anaerolineae bacterium]
MMINSITQLAATPPVSPQEEARLLQLIGQGRQAAALLAAVIGDNAADATALRRQVEEGQLARGTLVQANGRLVISIAARYQRLGLTMEELCQEGVIGLMRAIDKWRPGQGATRLSTYATWWIRQAIGRAVADQGRAIRLPVYQAGRLSRLRRVAARLNQENGAAASLEEIAAAANEPVETVRELWGQAQPPVSLDTPLGDDDDNTPWGEVVAGVENTPRGAETALLAAIIEQALGELSAREEAILRMRFGLAGCSPEHQTLTRIAARYDLTRERIRQIEVEALAKLRANPKVSRLAGFLENC